MTLKDIKIGESAKIISVGGDGALRQHFLDMGIIPGVEIKVVKYAPMGDPIEILMYGSAVLTMTHDSFYPVVFVSVYLIVGLLRHEFPPGK